METTSMLHYESQCPFITDSKDAALSGQVPYLEGFDKIFNAAYQDLMLISIELSKYSEILKNARKWCSNCSMEVYSEAFTAACIVQTAGFPLIRDQRPLRKHYEAKSPGIRNNSSVQGCTSIREVPGDAIRPWDYPVFYTDTEEKRYLEYINYENVDIGWSAQPNTILHELSHNVDFGITRNNDGEDWVKEVHRPMDKTLAYTVSGVSATNYMEYCAEVIASILSGCTYSDEIIRLLPECADGTPDSVRGAWDRLRDKGVNNRKGAFVPDLLKGVQRCTKDNILTFKPTAANRERSVYKFRKKVGEAVSRYDFDIKARLAVDLFCKVMNESFDYIYNNWALAEKKTPLYNVGDYISAEYGRVNDIVKARHRIYYGFTDRKGLWAQRMVAMSRLSSVASSLVQANWELKHTINSKNK